MKKYAALFLFASAALSMPATAQVPPTNPAAHVELRAVKDRLVAAVNKKDEAALLAELDPKVSFTAMNNETFHGTDGAKAYFHRMLVGSSRVVEDMSLSATPDDLAILYSGDSAAVATGTSNAHFKIMGRKEFDVPLRWTATLVKNDNGWKVASAHFSANMFDNPIMNEIKHLTWWIAGGVGLLGLLIGWLLGRMRRKPA